MRVKALWPKLVDIIGDGVTHYPYSKQEFMINEIFNLVDNIVKFTNRPIVYSDQAMDKYLLNLNVEMDILFTSIDNRVDIFELNDQLIILSSILKCLSLLLDKAIEKEEYEFAANIKNIREFIIFYKK